MAPANKFRARRGWFALAVILGLAVFFAWRFFFGSSAKAPMGMMAGAAAPVRVAAAIAQDVPYFLNGLGTVAPSGDVLVQSRVAGQLLKLHFKEGQRVNTGAVLAEIDPRPFQAALDKAKGSLEQAKAQLANAKSDLARYAKLSKGDYIAEQQYENQKSLVRQLEGAVEASRGEVDSAALQLEYSVIKAPIGGRLGLRTVDEGNQITANDPAGLVRITETTPCDVLFTLPETQVSLVARALFRREKDKSLPPLMVQAWDREDQKLLGEGELVSMDNQIDQATGTVKLKARFANKDHALYPNQFVNARLLVETIKDAVTVPAAAVQLGANGSYCYVVAREEVADKIQEVVKYRDIRPGVTDASIQVVDSGITIGEQVVVDGVDRLRDGMVVRIAATVETERVSEDTPPDSEG